MVIAKIYPTTRFTRSFRRLPDNIKKKAVERERIFKENPFDPRLDTHKTKGKLQGLLAYSVDFHYRVLFHFLDEKTVLYHDIGDHSLYS